MLANRPWREERNYRKSRRGGPLRPPARPIPRELGREHAEVLPYSPVHRWWFLTSQYSQGGVTKCAQEAKTLEALTSCVGEYLADIMRCLPIVL